MWPQSWMLFTQRSLDHEPGQFTHVRELFGLRRVYKIDVPDDFTTITESDRAELNRLTKKDVRLALAVSTAGKAGKVTQILAGGVQLVDRYDHILSPYAKAVITAAADCYRLGHHAPFAPTLLEQSIAGYLDPQQRVGQSNWFAHALKDATAEIHGVRALSPIRITSDIGESDGYTLHDYVYQHVRTTLTELPTPASTWNALVKYAARTDDLYRLAGSARSRYFYKFMLTYADLAASNGDMRAATEAACVLQKIGRNKEAFGSISTGG